MGQLAIAWAAHNPRVSTVITGASKIEQLKDNLGAAEVIARLTPEVMAHIDKITRPLLRFHPRRNKIPLDEPD